MEKKKNKKIRWGRIIGCILLIIALIILINNLVKEKEPIQTFEIQTAKIEIDKNDIENIIITQNIPIPEDILQKRREEKAEAERIAEEERIAQEKAEEEARQEAIRVAQITSRSSVERSNQSTEELQDYAYNLCINEYGWDEEDFECLVALWNRESHWNPNAHNSSSGAHGIPQSLPASKMASEGDDYYTNGETQIRWGLKYIAGRYGNPTNAWEHSQNKGWY